MRVIYILFFLSFMPNLALAEGCSCSDKEDHLHSENVEFAKSWDSCGSKSMGCPRKTTQCLAQKHPGISETCLNCFGQFTTCSKANCWAVCMVPFNKKNCEICAITHCGPELAACTGIELADFPSKEQKQQKSC